jgi:hypothetical protein
VKDRAASIFPFVIAIALPPAGLILGVFQMTQEDRELGMRIAAVAILAMIVWAWLLI